MKNCKRYIQKIEKALYHELDKSEIGDLNNHLEECESCSKLYRDLTETVSVLKNRKREEPDPEFIDNLWTNIQTKLEPQKKVSILKFIWKSVHSLKIKKQFVYQFAGGFAILIIGLFIGRYFFNSPVLHDENLQPDSIIMAQNIDERVERYIGRSKVLLLGLMNMDPTSDDLETVNIEHQQKISSELISEAQFIKTNLERSPDQQLQRLVSDLEIILLQIANLEKSRDLTGIELIKDGVDMRGIFLKINIQEMRKSRSIESNSGKSVSEKSTKNI